MSATAEMVECRSAVASVRQPDDPRRPPAGSSYGARSARDGAGGESTLDGFLTGVWERLTVNAVAQCPVCLGTLEARHASPGATRGRCQDCGTTLS